MRRAGQVLGAALAVAGALALASAAQAKGAAVTFADSGKTTTIDCAGSDLAVTGSDDRLQVSGCDTLQVSGSRNRIRATLLETSSIAAFGDDNVVTWTPAPGASPPVSSTGRHNEINPVFGAPDTVSRPPAPIGATPIGPKS